MTDMAPISDSRGSSTRHRNAPVRPSPGVAALLSIALLCLSLTASGCQSTGPQNPQTPQNAERAQASDAPSEADATSSAREAQESPIRYLVAHRSLRRDYYTGVARFEDGQTQLREVPERYDFARSIPEIESLASRSGRAGDFQLLALMLRDASNDVHEAARRTLLRRFPELRESWDAVRRDVIGRSKRPSACDTVLAWWREVQPYLAWDVQSESFVVQAQPAALGSKVDPSVALALRVISELDAEEAAKTSGGGRITGTSRGEYLFSLRLSLPRLAPEHRGEQLRLWDELGGRAPVEVCVAAALILLRDSSLHIHHFAANILESAYGVSFADVRTSAFAVTCDDHGIAIAELDTGGYIAPSDREQAFLVALEQLQPRESTRMGTNLASAMSPPFTRRVSSSAKRLRRSSSVPPDPPSE